MYYSLSSIVEFFQLSSSFTFCSLAIALILKADLAEQSGSIDSRVDGFLDFTIKTERQETSKFTW